ncbi:hypothetical protein AB0L42_35390 [Streptomyces sp. NPDC052287]|uniref:hypothetical protein n=1 Tax=Streptomyces sp. NPDC052287 TaxID=3154950 RepID=UPI0034451B6F
MRSGRVSGRPWWLLCCAALFVCLAGWLLTPRSPVSAPAPTTAQPQASGPDSPGQTRLAAPASPQATAAPSASTAAASSAPSPAREVPTSRVDAAVQSHLEQSWPKDLPTATALRLVRDGEAVLHADATGSGRDRWPTAFGTSRPGAGEFTRLRVQAAIARRDGSSRQAVVHLVWAGTDPGGSYAENRVTDIYFTLTSTKGHSVWTPQPLR